MVAAAPSQLHCDEISTFQVAQGAVAELQFNIKDINNHELNLVGVQIPDPITASGSSSSAVADDELTVCMFVRESFTDTTVLVNTAGEVIDEATGLVRFVLDETDTKHAGTFTGEVIVSRGDTRLHVMKIFLSIYPSLSSVIADISPALDIPWIRLMLRDTCPDANYLLDELEFSDTEVAFALRHPIDEWNEIPPDIVTHTPKTFPYRNHHSRAAIAELMLLAGHWYLRNNLSYATAGVSVNDRDKGNAYITLGMQYREEWKQWIQNKKIELNVEGGFQQLLSPYTFIDAFYGFYGF